MDEGDDQKRRVDFGDGIEAVDRVQRTAIMLIAQAQNHLLSLGYDRLAHLNVELHEEGIPVWLTLRGKRVYEVGFESAEGGEVLVPITLRGHWLHKVKKRGIISRILGR